ncbi:hypothetical protein D7X74_21260 [Corallococcus sp. CA047B]|uniref:hypothetical protein n=1 Tax=Corallococcus sp. CA047B TaxID=2316729 RepID=UPI000EA1E3E8|nr:hypothetical protein [Corallococcus sp. CA047B]RKH13779.1 hypothetical protein D7X74_21260 [Corallococcus sp. CA047B]
MGDHLKPQPAPAANDKAAVWDLVAQDLEQDEGRLAAGPMPSRPWAERHVVALVRADAKARDVYGREHYGTPLQAGNGRDALVDAYQEALDLAVYLRQALEEQRESAFTPDRQDYVVEHLTLLYANARGTVRHLRWLLYARDGR